LKSRSDIQPNAVGPRPPSAEDVTKTMMHLREQGTYAASHAADVIAALWATRAVGQEGPSEPEGGG